MSDRNVSQKTRYLRPRSVISEARDGKLRVVLEMPGVRREGLDVRIENNELLVIGHRDPPGSGRFVLRERPQGDYHQTYTLDETVDQSKIDAVLERGILTIALDLKEYVKPRVIQVRGE